MSGGETTPGSGSNRVLLSLPYVSLLGLAGLATNIILSFEEPHTPMLLVSALLLSAAPVGVLVHLAATPELTREEKRMWLAGLLSQNGPTLFAAYFNARHRCKTTAKLAGGRNSVGGQA